jgi:hypothetical protein
VAGVVAWTAAIPPAQAQFLLWPQFRSGWRDYPPVRHKHRHKDAYPRTAKKAPAQDAAKGPLQVIVSIADQQISVYDNGALIARSEVSTGVPDHPTPLGIFSVITKHKWHRSNLYSDAPMPYMQRITWSGIALHAGPLPGYPASHGCIRLKMDFAVRLWHLTKRGTRVIIAPTDVQPVEIAHPLLPQPKPKTATISDDTLIEMAEAHSLSTATDAAQPAAIPNSAQKKKPLSIVVSRKSNTLYVRQGFQNLFETPVTIQDPEAPLGTHLFTLMAAPTDGAEYRWTVVTIPKSSRASQASKRRKPVAKETVGMSPLEPSPGQASAALARIEIPGDAMEQIAELLTPGSSLIVSDYGISKETGHDTDFIVETR